MDNLTLEALVDELKPQLLQRRCAKVVQICDTALAIEWSSRETARLVFEFADPPLCFLTASSWALVERSTFVALMRKWLMGTRLDAITKHLDERIVHFEFGGTTTACPAERFSLVAEMMPRWGNLYVLDAQHAVLGFLLRSRAERRTLDVGSLYTPPTQHGDLSLEEFVSPVTPAPALPTDVDELTKRVRGLTPIFATEILHRCETSGQTPPEILSQLLAQLSVRKLQPRVYETSRHATDWFISPLALESLRDRTAIEFATMNAAVTSVFEHRMEASLLETGRKSLQREMRPTLKRFKRIKEKLEEEARVFEKETQLQRVADLILAQPDKWHPRGGRIEVADVFDPKRPKLAATIDPRLGAVANAQRFYEQAKRARRGLGKIRMRQITIGQMIHALESGLEQLAAAKSVAEMEEISRFLRRDTMNAIAAPREAIVLAAATRPTPPQKKRKCRVFLSSDSFEILVGRNSKENDWVTTQYAQADDYWFHVADYSGSHVLLRNPRREDLEDTDGFVEAAQLAAYFSQARNAKKVLVHWTQRRFVKKPKRARPGLVTLSKFQSITVEPKLPGSPHPDE